VNDGVHIAAGGQDRAGIANVSLDRLNSQGIEFRITSAGERSHSIATIDKLFHDIAAQKTAAAGHEDFQWLLLTQTARAAFATQKVVS
jgi:hypothetical protein